MLLRKSIEKTKNFFQTSVLNLKSVLCGEYEKLPKPPLLNPFSYSICESENEQTDEYYTEWESNVDEAKQGKNDSIIPSKEPANEEECSARFMSFEKQNELKNRQEVGRREEKKKGSCRIDKREDPCCHNMTAERELCISSKNEANGYDGW